MRVKIFTVDTEGRPYVAGTLELRDGKIVTVPCTTDVEDHTLLKSVAEEPILVLDGEEYLDLDPKEESEKFLTWLHRGLTGSMVRAGKQG